MVLSGCIRFAGEGNQDSRCDNDLYNRHGPLSFIRQFPDAHDQQRDTRRNVLELRNQVRRLRPPVMQMNDHNRDSIHARLSLSASKALVPVRARRHHAFQPHIRRDVPVHRPECACYCQISTASLGDCAPPRPATCPWQFCRSWTPMPRRKSRMTTSAQPRYRPWRSCPARGSASALP